MPSWLTSIILGITEGLTEFIPVSSTAHVLLLGDMLGFNPPGHSFEVLIQLGAILAVVVLYFTRLFSLFIKSPFDKQARFFFYGIFLAFLPAAILGATLYALIKDILFNLPVLICSVLILGGIILLLIDRLPFTPRHTNAMSLPLPVCLVIGICQSIALIPGTSRSGATIVGALLFGVEKKTAAEFSFFLAIPTMLGAFSFDLYKNIDVLAITDFTEIAIGFTAAFLTALCVVKCLLTFVGRYGFAPFAYWRIGIGSAGLIALAMTGNLI